MRRAEANLSPNSITLGHIREALSLIQFPLLPAFHFAMLLYDRPFLWAQKSSQRMFSDGLLWCLRLKRKHCSKCATELTIWKSPVWLLLSVFTLNLSVYWYSHFIHNNSKVCNNLLCVAVEAGHIFCDPGSRGVGTRAGLQDNDHIRHLRVHPSTVLDRDLYLFQEEEAYWRYVTVLVVYKRRCSACYGVRV